MWSAYSPHFPHIQRIFVIFFGKKRIFRIFSAYLAHILIIFRGPEHIFSIERTFGPPISLVSTYYLDSILQQNSLSSVRKSWPKSKLTVVSFDCIFWAFTGFCTYFRAFRQVSGKYMVFALFQARKDLYFFPAEFPVPEIAHIQRIFLAHIPHIQRIFQRIFWGPFQRIFPPLERL